MSVQLLTCHSRSFHRCNESTVKIASIQRGDIVCFVSKSIPVTLFITRRIGLYIITYYIESYCASSNPSRPRNADLHLMIFKTGVQVYLGLLPRLLGELYTHHHAELTSKTIDETLNAGTFLFNVMRTIMPI